jgi:hypothetical protein
MNRIFALLLIIIGLIPGAAFAFDVPIASHAPVVDGDPGDVAWERSEWIPMDKLILGTMPEHDDFSGRYKLVWTAEHVYLLAEIADDILYDSHPDPLVKYWDDDALEIFIDASVFGEITLVE